MKLSSLVGKEVLAKIPAVDGDVISVKVVGVEEQGLWVENDHLRMTIYGSSLGKMPGEKPIFFVPFSAIDSLAGWTPSRS